MKPIFVYLAGVATPITILIILFLIEVYRDWRVTRRYRMAWEKFTAEWDAMCLSEQRDFIAKLPDYQMRYATDRDTYFSVRWKYGRTTEI